MASQHGIQPSGKIFIPPCKNAICESWIRKVDEFLKLDLKCVTKPNINASFVTQFKKNFQECDFTILHFCPFLWKRISKLEEFLREMELKLILVTFNDESLIDSFMKASEVDNCGVKVFFEDFDSEQTISDDVQVLQSFKDHILSCISDSENTPQVDATFNGSSTRSQLLSSGDYEMEEGSMEENEDGEEDVECFVNYSHLISNFTSLFVTKKIAQCDGHINIQFSDTGISPLKKAMLTINEMADKHTEEKVTATLKYLSQQAIPEFFKNEDIVRLASFSMCRNPPLLRLAMDCLELLLWEKVDQVQDFRIWNHVEKILTNALKELQLDYEKNRDKSYLMMLQTVANVHLIVLGSILNQIHENPDMASIYYSYLSDRSGSPFVSSKPGSNFDLENQFEVAVCLGIIDSVVKGVNARKLKSAEHILQNNDKIESQKLLEKMIDKGMAVHLLVVTHLLRKVFCLEENALTVLNQYMDGPKEKSPFVFTILHALHLFLAYKTQKDAHMDINTICKDSLLVIKKAMPNGQQNQIESFLQGLLFNSNPSIRHELIKLFRQKDRYGLMLQYLQREMEQRLNPLLRNLKSTSSGFGWKKATGKFNNQDAWIFFYSMNERDHKKNQTEFSEKDLHFTEMKMLTVLQHRNIIKLLAYQSDCIPQFYLTENCNQHLQGHLENKWKNNACYLPSQLLQFLLDAVTALKFCHGKGYVHCNLTAESLIVFDHAHVKLAGFGLCKKIDPLTGKAYDINSKDIAIRWSAPESILNGEYSEASDMWMVGQLLYEVMTHGLLPYSYMEKSDEELIEQMKEKKLVPTIEPVVKKEREDILHLLSRCAYFDPESRIDVAHFKANLKFIFNKVKHSPEKKVTLKTFDKEKSSTNCRRGVPEKFHKGVKVFKDVTHQVDIKEGLDKFQEGDDFVFIEKIKHVLPASMETFFKSPILDNILPQRRDIGQSKSEMKKIVCKIPCENCYSLLEVASNKMVKEVGQIISLMQMVAAKLAALSKHVYVIGDICASSVFVELSDTPKVHIISLAYLRTIDYEEEIADNQVTTSCSETVKRRASSEVIQYGRFSAASDVFCFGNFMWELLTAFSKKKASSSFFNRDIKIFSQLQGSAEICDAILSGNWEKYHRRPKCCPESLYELIKSCVSPESDRPRMDLIAVKLQEHCNASIDSSRDQIDTDGSSSNRNSATLSVENPSVNSNNASISSDSNNSSVASLPVANPSIDSSFV